MNKRIGIARIRAVVAATLFCAGLIPAVPLTAQTETDALRAELEALRTEYLERIQELERRLAALESRPETGQEVEEKDQALADLRAAAKQAAEQSVETAPPSTPTSGREGNLNRLNPEISFTGILLGNASGSDREEFQAEEFELDLQSALDPFTRTRWTLAFGEEGIEIEEGYVLYNALPAGLQLTAGKFRQRFGPLNRQHLHALPQSNYPLVYQTYFGEEGLAQTGLSLSWLPANPWASANEVTLEVTDGENEEAFAGEHFEDFSFLGRLKNYWELSPATYFEWGLSGVSGKTADGGDSRVYGTDFTVSWQPPQRAKYRSITWRTEFLLSRRQDLGGEQLEAWGGYTYLEGLLHRNLWAGIRHDRVEDPLQPEARRWGVVPYLTWWQSEYVRLRGEYHYVKDEMSGETDDRFTLQLTWAAGPHKHETY